LGQERAQLEQIVIVLDELSTGLNDAGELLSMAVEEDDADTVAEVERDIGRYEQKLAALEFRRMFSGEMDANNAYVDIQSGAGGTEAQARLQNRSHRSLRWRSGRHQEFDGAYHGRVRVWLVAYGDGRSSPRA